MIKNNTELLRLKDKSGGGIGKWNKSEPIYGKAVPAQKETYQF